LVSAAPDGARTSREFGVNWTLRQFTQNLEVSQRRCSASDDLLMR